MTRFPSYPLGSPCVLSGFGSGTVADEQDVNEMNVSPVFVLWVKIYRNKDAMRPLQANMISTTRAHNVHVHIPMFVGGIMTNG